MTDDRSAPNRGQPTRWQQVAAAATVVVPLGLSGVLFLYGWLRASGSGAGLSEDNRPIAVFMLATLGAANWFMGTSALFAVHASANRLPRIARQLALYLAWGPSWMGAHETGWRSREDVLPPMRRSMPAAGLFGLALVTLPLMLFVAPLLLGLLAQPGVWRSAESAAVAGMGGVAIGWSVFLVGRWRGSEPDGTVRA
jgi:hypothetical protein